MFTFLVLGQPLDFTFVTKHTGTVANLFSSYDLNVRCCFMRSRRRGQAVSESEESEESEPEEEKPDVRNDPKLADVFR
jgi:hypothetical protein